MFKKILTLFSLAAMVFTLNVGAPVARAEESVSIDDLDSGDLIRGQSFSAVYYYGEDGFRYTFPNSNTYFTWYMDFSDVKWLSDADLGKIQIGGNVTYKPGSRLIKINSDPKTYAIDEGGTIRWVTSEAVAQAMYGSTWNTFIDDVPDGFFPNYERGADLETADEAEEFMAGFEDVDYDINADKDLEAAMVVLIEDNSFSDTEIHVVAGTAIRFENWGMNKHTATAEDLSWGTGTLNNGDSFTRYFNEAGEYEFFCSYHSSMTGTITVE